MMIIVFFSSFFDGRILVDTSEICRLESLGVGIYTVAPLARLSSSEPKILLIKLYLACFYFYFFGWNNFGKYVVVGSDARLGVGIYAVASASRRVAHSPKILLIKFLME